MQDLIHERFDKFTSAQQNGTTAASATESSPPESNGDAAEKAADKRQSDDSPNESSSPKKKRKMEQHIDDAKLAAMLQAQENSLARPTRGGANRKTMTVRKKTPKKKSAAKIKTGDDSDVELGSDGEPKEVVRKGGFHVCFPKLPTRFILLRRQG